MNIVESPIPDQYMLEDFITIDVNGHKIEYLIQFSVFGQVFKVNCHFLNLPVNAKRMVVGKAALEQFEKKIKNYSKLLIYQVAFVKIGKIEIEGFYYTKILQKIPLSQILDGYTEYVTDPVLLAFYRNLHQRNIDKTSLDRLTMMVHDPEEIEHPQQLVIRFPLLIHCEILKTIIPILDEREIITGALEELVEYKPISTTYLLEILYNNRKLRHDVLHILTNITSQEKYDGLIEFYHSTKTEPNNYAGLAISQLGKYKNRTTRKIVQEVLDKFDHYKTRYAIEVLIDWGVSINEIRIIFEHALINAKRAHKLITAQFVLQILPKNIHPTPKWLFDNIVHNRQGHPFTFYKNFPSFLNAYIQLHPNKRKHIYLLCLDCLESDNQNIIRLGLYLLTNIDRYGENLKHHPFEKIMKEVLPLVKHPSVCVQEWALIYLNKYVMHCKEPSKQVLTCLLQKINKKNIKLRSLVLRIIGHLLQENDWTDKVCFSYLRYLHSDDRIVRISALSSLATCNNVYVLEYLIRLKNQQTNHHYQLENVIKRITEKIANQSAPVSINLEKRMASWLERNNIDNFQL